MCRTDEPGPETERPDLWVLLFCSLHHVVCPYRFLRPYITCHSFVSEHMDSRDACGCVCVWGCVCLYKLHQYSHILREPQKWYWDVCVLCVCVLCVCVCVCVCGCVGVWVCGWVCVFIQATPIKSYITWTTKVILRCVCFVCVCGHVYVVYEDTNVYNDMGIT